MTHTHKEVKVWEESVTIPTYGVGQPEKNPVFLEKRVYQGSCGEVYPHPVIEKIFDEKEDKTYHAVYLENDYLKIMILPELGGRVQMAYDKARQRHFVYYNRVIKPALVGLTGPWISGGIEFNWPQHHRPSTFDPLDFSIEAHGDGSKTVWVSEVEKMFRTKGMAGFRLYPGKAYLEINVKLYNRTPFAQTFLWWANPAVKANEHYQSVFPPDVHAVFDHGKRDVSEFPIAKGTYYKVDYSAGVDISRYKNIPVPTSYMAIQSKYNFMGGYEHDAKAGLIHVANRHISPGKKQWTWGNGEFGQAWDRNLTDEDGPYIELMTGVFTDNQPDFSWIQPNEERTFTQYFMPYSELGLVKNASKEAMTAIEREGNFIVVKFYATSEYSNAEAALCRNEKKIWSETISISPSKPFIKAIAVSSFDGLDKISARLTSEEGKRLVEYAHEKPVGQKIPEAAKPVKEPEAIESTEELFLSGLHIEQYRHATYNALDYYYEALRRDPGDSRNNHAAGLYFLKRGQFAKAEPYFRKAIETLTQRNPNPCDGAPYFNLGTCLSLQNRFDEAYEAWFKSAWNSAWQDAAYFNLARIEVRKGDFEEALALIDKSLMRNYASQSARHLKCVALRKSGRAEEALKFAEEALALDRFNVGCLFEKTLLLDNNKELIASLKKSMRGKADACMEYSLDYAWAGQFDDAMALLSLCETPHPMLHYYTGYCHWQSGAAEQAKSDCLKAASLPPDYCFPNRIEDVNVLQQAMKLNPDDSKAPYYLGNFWYAKKQYQEAIACWEKSRALDENFPVVHRNLALAYHNREGDEAKSLASLEKAFRLNDKDARVLMELDQLYRKTNKPLRERLEILEKHMELTNDRDDLYLERITLKNLIGQYHEAKELIAARKFHPWEGGEGKAVGQYAACHLALARKNILRENYEQAISLLEEAETYPPNLGEGKLFGTRENDIFYFKGCAYEGLKNWKQANFCFEKAAEGNSEPVQAVYYNDQPPDKILYQGLAQRKLGEEAKADLIFNRLIEFGAAHENDHVKIDYFAVSLPDLLVFNQDLGLRNKIHCGYMRGLGHLGLGGKEVEKAKEYFHQILALDVNHQGALAHLEIIESGFVSDLLTVKR